MNPSHVPSLSEVVDVLTARIEWADTQGLDDEAAALKVAREAITDHVFREHRNRSLIRLILSRLHIRPAA